MINAYKFNGQELQDELGLNLYDMDLRDYDPAIARWTGVDPVTHFSQSPYNAFDGNPVLFADPSGADSIIYGMSGQTANANQYSRGHSSFGNASYSSNYSDPLRKGTGAGWGDRGLLPRGSSLTITLDWADLCDNTQMFFSNSGIDVVSFSDDYSELLSEITLIANKSGMLSDKAGSQIQDHVYRNSGAYQSFYGSPIRIIPDFGVASYFGGAINMPEKNWMSYLKNGLNSSDGRLMMHEYGHYLQNKSGGSFWYNSYPAPSSMLDSMTNSSTGHHKHWAEIQASTLAYYYFGFPSSFTKYNIVDPSYISAKQQSALYNQYLSY